MKMIQQKWIRISILFFIFSLMLCSTGNCEENLVNDFSFEVRTSETGLEVSVPVCTLASGGALTRLAPGASVNVKVNAKMTVAGKRKVIAVVSVYNADDTMEAASFSREELEGPDEKPLSVDIILPPGTNDGYYLKTYVLAGFDDMWAYNEAFCFPQNGVVDSKWDIGGRWSMSSDCSFGGYSSLKLDALSSGDVCSQQIDLEKNEVYKMRFNARGDTAFGYYITDSAGSAITKEKKFSQSPDWTENELVFKTSDDKTVNVCFVDSGGTGTAYIDNVSISGDFVINGGFENHDTNWVTDSDCFFVSGDDKSEGNNSLKVTSVRQDAEAYQEITVMPQSKMMLYFKSKCSEKLECIVTDEYGVPLKGELRTDTKTSSDWRQNYIFVNTYDNSKIRVVFRTNSSNSKVSYIDDVRLENLKYSEELVNSDFENGVNGWSSSYNAAYIPSDIVFSGNGAAFVSERNFVYSGISQEVTDILNKYGSGKYYLQCWVKTERPLPRGNYLTVGVRYTPTGGSLFLNGTTGEYQKVSGVLDIAWAEGKTLERAAIKIETSGTSDDILINYYVDDVSFFKLSD